MDVQVEMAEVNMEAVGDSVVKTVEMAAMDFQLVVAEVDLEEKVVVVVKNLHLKLKTVQKSSGGNFGVGVKNANK